MSNPLSQRIVPFEGDELIGVQNTDGAVYAVFSRLCDNLTVNREGQVRRIRAHAVMNTALVPLTVETLGGTQQVLCLKLSMIPLWLSSLQANRIKDEQIRVKLVRYQHDAADVLWQAFKPQIINEDQATELATSTDAELKELFGRIERQAQGSEGCGIDWAQQPEKAAGDDPSLTDELFRGDTCNCQARVRRNRDNRVVGLLFRATC